MIKRLLYVFLCVMLVFCAVSCKDEPTPPTPPTPSGYQDPTITGTVTIPEEVKTKAEDFIVKLYISSDPDEPVRSGNLSVDGSFVATKLDENTSYDILIMTPESAASGWGYLKTGIKATKGTGTDASGSVTPLKKLSGEVTNIGTYPVNIIVENSAYVETLTLQEGDHGYSFPALPDSTYTVSFIAKDRASVKTPVVVNADKTLDVALPNPSSYYQVDDHGVLTVKDDCMDLVKLLETISIPAKIGETDVVKIGEKAFSGCSVLKTLVIPDSVTSLGKLAFDGCSGIEFVTMPFVLTDSFGIKGNTNLLTVELTGSTQTVPESMFEGCTSLVDVVFAEEITTIGTAAFKDCPALKDIHSTGSDMVQFFSVLTSIGKEAFYNCSSIAIDNLVINSSIIEEYAFFGCSSLTGTVRWPAGKAVVEPYTFKNCSGIKAIVFDEPNNITDIGAYAFYGCTELETINGDASLTGMSKLASIGEAAFGACCNLTKLAFYNGMDNVLNSLGISAFAGCKSLTTVDLSVCPSLQTVSYGLFSGCTALTSVTLPNTSLTSIGGSAFSGCTNLSTINLEAPSLTTIGSNAFRDCRSLTSIMPASAVLTSIGNYAFSGCTGLTDLDLSSFTVLTSIGASSFAGCTGIASVTLPDTVTTIGSSAFSNCTSLVSFTLPVKLSAFGKGIFTGCTSLTTLVLPNGLAVNNAKLNSLGCPAVTSIELKGWTTVPAGTFEGFTSMTSIVLGNTLKTIEANAFKGCTGLTSVTIPQSVTSIGVYAFSGCTALSSVTVSNAPSGSKLQSIGDYAFSDCTALTSVSLPETASSITFIGQGAFRNDTALTSFVVPDGVTSISGTFNGCTNLSSVKVTLALMSIGDLTFSNCVNLGRIDYNGTMADWQGISKLGTRWKENTGKNTSGCNVVCTDGTILI